MGNGLDPVADDELVYRRVPASTGWYDASTETLKPEAFAPHKTDDVTGLSISRAKYKSIDEAARGRPGKTYFVAILNAGQVRRAGIAVVPQPDLPTGYDPAHAELPDLNAGNRKSNETLQRQRILVQLCLEVKGPFATPQE